MACGRDVITSWIGILASASLLKQHVIPALVVLSYHPDMRGGMKASFPVGNAPLSHDSGLRAVRVKYIE